MDKKEKAIALHDKKFNCCQAVACAFASEVGMDEKTVFQAGEGFGLGMGGMDANMFAADQTLTLNANNELVKYIFEHKDSEQVPMFCEQLYDLAMLSNQPLSVDAMAKFVERSNKIMMLLAK